MSHAARKGPRRAWPAGAAQALALAQSLALAGVLSLAAPQAGCGLSSSPRPLAQLIVGPQGVRVWLRDGQVFIVWRGPTAAQDQRWGGLAAYHLSLVRLPLGCPECSPKDRRELVLPPHSPELVTDEGQVVYHFAPTGPPATWRAQVSQEFKHGKSAMTYPEFVDAVGNIPADPLRWERVGPETMGADGKPALRLYWSPRRERVVRVVTAGRGQFDRELLYRVNLYRRVPPAPWPVLPYNPQPIREAFWIGPEPYLVDGKPGQAVEYAMRLVDEFGNEGPASDPVSVTVANRPGI